MPPGLLSRHLLVLGATRLSDGQTFLLDREPYRFVPRADHRKVICGAGDTWQSLAFNYFSSIKNAEELWWVITDFQPDPIIDPTIPPVPGTLVYIPTEEFVLATLFSDSRRDEAII